jgi:uncharacterized protein YjbI with pentapeptide repeats
MARFAFLLLLMAAFATSNAFGQVIHGCLIAPKTRCPNVDLSGVNLGGAALNGDDLNGANLSQASLIGADLRGANLSGADLTGTQLSGANLTGTALVAVSGGGANLSQANLMNANLRAINLESAILDGANFAHVRLEASSLLKVSAQGTSFRWSNLSNADLRGGNFNHALFTRSILKATNFQQSILTASDFKHANLQQANLAFTDLVSTNLNFSNASRASLYGADLSHSSLMMANLILSNLTETRLTDANLTGAKLNGAFFNAPNPGMDNLDGYALGSAGPGGGLLFYVTPDGQHGLEAAPPLSSANWGCDATYLGVTSTTLGSGASNTALIESRGSALQCATNNSPTAMASAFSQGGYRDWYVPSRDEMALLISQVKDTPALYWTSSETSATSLWIWSSLPMPMGQVQANGTTVFMGEKSAQGPASSHGYLFYPIRSF